MQSDPLKASHILHFIISISKAEFKERKEEKKKKKKKKNEQQKE